MWVPQIYFSRIFPYKAPILGAKSMETHRSTDLRLDPFDLPSRLIVSHLPGRIHKRRGVATLWAGTMDRFKGHFTSESPIFDRTILMFPVKIFPTTNPLIDWGIKQRWSTKTSRPFPPNVAMIFCNTGSPVFLATLHVRLPKKIITEMLNVGFTHCHQPSRGVITILWLGFKPSPSLRVFFFV